MSARACRGWLAVAVLWAWAGVAVSAEPARGVFGVMVAVTAEGLFNPTVKVARIERVEPGWPAAQAGVAVGDQVLSVDGTRIPGATAAELAPLAKGKRIGERVALELARADGSRYSVQLTAVAPPRDRP